MDKRQVYDWDTRIHLLMRGTEFLREELGSIEH